MNVAPDDPPPVPKPSVVPGVVLGGAIGGGLLGATDAVVASAAAGQGTPSSTALLCGLLWMVGGAGIAFPWALFLRSSPLSNRPSLSENPRWWGANVAIAGAALAFVGIDLGLSRALLAAAPLLLCAAALSVLLETSRSRIFGMTGVLACLSIWAVVQQRDGPTGWPEGQARSVLLVTVEGLRSSDLDTLPRDGAWARWRAGGTTYRRVLLPAEEATLALRGLWRGEASWTNGGLGPGPVPTAAAQLAARGWTVRGHLGAGEVEDPGLTLRHEEPDWVPVWRGTRTGRLLGAQPTRSPARRVVAGARTSLQQRATRPQVLWVHLTDGRFPWHPPPPWDTALYEGDPWDATAAAPLPPDVRETWPGVADPAWVAAQRQGALASADSALQELAETLPGDGTWAVIAVGTAGPDPLVPQGNPLATRTGTAVVWAPGVLPAGAEVVAPVETAALAETLLELAGASAEATGGASLVPLAFGRRAPPLVRTSREGVPIVVSGEQTWEAGSAAPPAAAWQATADEVAEALP